MTFEELTDLGLPASVWSLIQLGLANAGFYDGTYKGRPGKKTADAYDRYLRKMRTPAWLEIAKLELGVKEYRGSADNQAVVKYLESVDALSQSAQRNDETPWCSAFVNWVMEQAGIQGTESAAARSWLSWGIPVDEPQEGCVVILSRGNPNGWQGHVGFFVDKTRKSAPYIRLLGGNQRDQVSVASYDADRVLGYRMPLTEWAQ